MDFNKINNDEFYNEEFYSLNLTMSLGRNALYTPQINGISMHLPSTPILYNWDNMPKVIFYIEFLIFDCLKSKSFRSNINRSAFKLNYFGK